MRRRWLAISAGVGVLALGGAAPADDGLYEELAALARAIHHIHKNHVRRPSVRELVDGAIQGMVARLDRFSGYLGPEEYTALLARADEDGGVGAFVERWGGRLVVADVTPDGPAALAGLRPGDELVALDGAPALGPAADVALRLRGRGGSEVELRLGDGRSVRVVRGPRPDPSVRARRLPGGRLYLRIYSFESDTAERVDRELEAVGSPAGVLLDLRDNTGGLLDPAVRIADRFLTSGVIVSTESTTGPPRVERAHAARTEAGCPVVVVINGVTASAAEVLASALAENGRATVLGTQSFGKATVQTIIELGGRGALRLTVARYFTPTHRSLDGVGVRPDVVVPPRFEAGSEPFAADVQLRAALELLSSSR